MSTTQTPQRSLTKTLASLPPPLSSLRSQTRHLLHTSASTLPLLVILDDDPTGTQTCHDIYVLTTWDVATLAAEFERTPRESGFFILTNSRALHAPQARELVKEICGNLQVAAQRAGKPFEVVLRGDSTLRGHFPGECEVVDEVLGAADAWILAPFFLAGGRYTVDDVHYVAEGDVMVPAGETPFARDATFGYRSSDLREWVVEKSKGGIGKERVKSLALEDTRTKGPDGVCEQLLGMDKGSVVVINAVSEEDMDAVVLGIVKASGQHGKRYLFRTAAAFVSARLAIDPIPPLSAKQLEMTAKTGGLIIAGSYVPKTTAQLAKLTEGSKGDLTTVVLDVNKLLSSPENAEESVANALAKAEQELQRGQDVLIMTSRDLIVGDDEKKSLDIGTIVARSLVTFLQRVQTRPRYIIAKGGITSSDMATKGLGMKRAKIVGQASAGVPLWQCDEPESKFVGIPYVVFPGNVGSESALYDLVRAWKV